MRSDSEGDTLTRVTKRQIREKQNAFFESKRVVDRRPVIEVVDYRVTAQTIDVPNSFDGLMRITVEQEWDTAGGKFLWTEFAAGAALSVGIQMIIDGKNLFPERIMDNHDWKKYAFDTDIVIDGGVTQVAQLSARISLFKMLGNNHDGLVIDVVKDSPVQMAVVVGDDLSARGTELKMFFQGWKNKVRL